MVVRKGEKMNRGNFALSLFLIISITINILQILNFNYKYKRIENVYLKKEKRLLEKEVEQQKEIIALQQRHKIREIK